MRIATDIPFLDLIYLRRVGVLVEEEERLATARSRCFVMDSRVAGPACFGKRNEWRVAPLSCRLAHSSDFSSGPVKRHVFHDLPFGFISVIPRCDSS